MQVPSPNSVLISCGDLTAVSPQCADLGNQGWHRHVAPDWEKSFVPVANIVGDVQGKRVGAGTTMTSRHASRVKLDKRYDIDSFIPDCE